MYLHIGYSEEQILIKKLNFILLVKKLDKYKKIYVKTRRELQNNKFIYTDTYSLEEISKDHKILIESKNYNIKGSFIEASEYMKMFKKIALVKYLKMIIPDRKHKFIDIKQLDKPLYIYRLLNRYANISKESKFEDTSKFSEFSIYVYPINDIIEILRNKSLIKLVYDSVHLLSANSEDLYKFLLLTYELRESLEELLTTLDAMGEYTDVIQEMLGSDITYIKLLEYISHFINLSVVAKHIPFSKFHLVNINEYAHCTIQQTCTIDPIYDISDAEDIIRNIISVYCQEGANFEVRGLKNEEFFEIMSFESEKEIEEFKDQSYDICSMSIHLPLRLLSAEEIEILKEYRLNLITADEGDYAFYSCITDIEENILKLWVSDGQFVNSDFIETLIKILLLCNKKLQYVHTA